MRYCGVLRPRSLPCQTEIHDKQLQEVKRKNKTKGTKNVQYSTIQKALQVKHLGSHLTGGSTEHTK